MNYINEVFFMIHSTQGLSVEFPVLTTLQSQLFQIY
jgi:hypothetical protein